MVDVVDLATARSIIEKLHYARSSANTATYRHGLFRKSDMALVGAAVWIPPTKNAAHATYPENWRGVLSLSRLVVDPFVPTNGASFLLGRSIALIKEDNKWDCLVTYADTWRGHTGQIYKATNWEYVGMTAKSPVWVNEEGAMMGRKRGPKTLTYQEMSELGFSMIGRFAKHKFRMVLHPRKTTPIIASGREIISDTR